MAGILRLEDQRVLRDPSAAPTSSDLGRLLTDDEARVRRRAALAVGRVGLAEGVPLLVGLLRDSDPEVRQMAAFGLGLLGDRSARDPLVGALGDPSPIVQGSAAEALGLLGDAGAADAIGRLASQIVQSGALADPPGDEGDARRDTPAAAFRLGIYALVRLKAYPQLAAAVLDANGQPRVRWWPVAFALQRLEDPRALPALLTLAKDAHPYTRAFAVKGLGALKDRAALPVLMPLLSSGERNVLVETIRALGRIGDGSAAEPLLKILRDASADPQVRLEAAGTIGQVHASDAPGATRIYDALLDLLADPSPAMRGAALRSLASFDADNFVAVLSGLDPDPDWAVRASLATVLGTLAPEVGLRRLQAMLNDADQRVIPFVLASLVKLKAPNTAAVLLRAPERRRCGGAGGRGDGSRRSPRREWPGCPGRGVQLWTARSELHRAGRGAGRDREVRRRRGDARAEERVRRQGLGGPRPCGDAPETTRPGRGGRGRRADSAGADHGHLGCVPGAARGRPAGVDPGVPRHRPRHDPDRAGGARRAADHRELHQPRAERLLQRPARSPRRARLRRAGRRSARRRGGDAGLLDS